MSNKNLRALARALDLSRHDVAEIVTMGGVPTSSSRADAWLRSDKSTKNPTGNSDFRREIPRRKEITPEEFDAFCSALKSWLDKHDM